VTQVRIGKGGRREGRPEAEAGQAWYLLYCKSIKDDANLFFAWRVALPLQVFDSTLS